ncbi:MAG: hypothetical protein HRU01_13430, partial [Myxococcales bacterium]|nr:hypothetical protein [Myxococcales bacterium]
KLSEKRQDLILNMKENNYNANELIANLYSEPSHFIYELLQNAEDSQASEIRFELEPDSLTIIHNGKDFNYDDVESITTIGNSTKANDLTKIGKFGAGFKSVYAITDSPLIYSGEYSFEIKDYIVPYEIKNIEIKKETKIVLPFNSNKINKEMAFSIINRKLYNLEVESLLFLKNIKSISWIIDNETFYLKKEIRQNKNCQYIDIHRSKYNETKKYIKIDKTININNKELTLSISYALEDDKVIAINSSKLSVFFSTEVSNDYKFLLHAPYKTTPNRESIPFKDEENQKITEALSKHVANSFLVLKEESYLNHDFFERMAFYHIPCSNILFASIYSEIKNIFYKEKLLLSLNNEFVLASELILISSKILEKFSNKVDLSILLNNKVFYSKMCDCDFSYFLQVRLGIKLLCEDSLFKKIDNEFIIEQSDSWLKGFYIFLSNSGISKYSLANPKLIKLNNDSFISLYKSSDDLKPQVYIDNGSSSKFNILNKLFTEDKDLKPFFEKYNITKPNKISELKEFVLSKYKYNNKNFIKEEYLVDFNQIIKTYNSSNNSEKEQILSLCENYDIALTNKNKLCRIECTYIPTNELKSWFFNSPDIDFLDTCIVNDNSKDFLINMSSKQLPSNSRYFILGLNENLNNISFDTSLLIWEFLTNTLSDIYIEKDSSNLTYSSQSIICLKEVLNDSIWLKSKFQENFSKVSALTLLELDHRYKYDDELAKYIEDTLKFKLDKIKEIEEEYNGVFIEKEEFEEFQKWKDEKNKTNIVSDEVDNTWIPNIDVNNINTVEKEYYNNSNYSYDLSYQSKRKDTFKTTIYNKNFNNIQSLKKIGDWGENLVYKYLKNEYKDIENIEIKWLNQDSYLGIGYDFVIIENNIEVEYIEVKSKVSPSPTMIEVSGTQWEWARNLHSKNNGDMYKIYVVSGAGCKDAKIKIISNPIKKWKDGDLKVNPVHIEL